MNISRFFIFILLVSFSHLSFATKCLDEVRATVATNSAPLPEFLKGKIDSFLYKKTLQKYKNKRGITEINEEAQKKIGLFNKRFQYCTSSPNNKLHSKATSVFSKIATQYSMALSIASYIATHLGGEKNSEWFKRLGFEVVSTYAFSKIPGLVMRNSKSSNNVKMMKEIATNLSLDYGVTRVYGEFLAPEDKVVNYKLDEESKKILDKKLIEIISTPKFQELLGTYYEHYNDYLKSDGGVDEGEVLKAVQSNEELKALLEQNYLKVKNSLQKETLANDMFKYDTLYAFGSSRPKIAMYDSIIKMICLGYPRSSIGLFVFFRIFSSVSYFSGRAIYTESGI